MIRFDQWAAHAAPFLTWLLQNSLWASAVALLVLIVQGVFGRWLTPAWRYRLWGLVVIRLLLPMTPASPMSIANLGGIVSWQKVARSIRAPRQVALQDEPVHVDLEPASDAQPRVTVTYGEPPPFVDPPRLAASIKTAPKEALPGHSRTFTAIAMMWLVGMAILFSRLIFANIRLARRLRRAMPLEDSAILSLRDVCCREIGLSRRPEILISDVVAAPAAAGVWRARILLPDGLLQTLSPTDLRAVLLRELAHIRCRDVAGNWLLAVLHIIHWFNPLLWLAFGRLQADREIARDAMVPRGHCQSRNARAAGTDARLCRNITEIDGVHRAVSRISHRRISRPGWNRWRERA